MIARYLMIAAVATACATPAPPPADTAPVDTPRITVPPPATGMTGDQAWDQAVIAQADRDARKLAIADGCGDAGSCRTAPVGVRACGGPRDHVAYCVTATDTAALFRKLAELARLEQAYNERYGIMSTCEFRDAPATALVGQSCRAVR